MNSVCSHITREAKENAFLSELTVVRILEMSDENLMSTMRDGEQIQVSLSTCYYHVHKKITSDSNYVDITAEKIATLRDAQ